MNDLGFTGLFQRKGAKLQRHKVNHFYPGVCNSFAQASFNVMVRLKICLAGVLLFPDAESPCR